MLPGRRVERCRRVVKKLPKATPPRARAAVLRTWLDGWCTARRFGTRGTHCRFGCQFGEDSLEHYLRCSRLWRFGSTALQLHDPVDPTERTTAALLWETGCSEQRLGRLATLVAVGYKACNTLRHSRCQHGGGLDIQRLFRQTLAELQQGDAG